MRLLATVLAGVLASVLAWAADLPSREELQRIVADIGRITGLPSKKEVPVEQMTRERLRDYLTERMKKVMKPDEIRADELTLKWLGLVPADFNLAESTIDLLTEQAAAFYDYRKKKLVLLENPVGEFDRTVLAHELAHALADQHFRIGRFMDDRAATDDGVLARLAVVEGQASWIMTEFSLEREGGGTLFGTSGLLPKESSFDPKAGAAFPVLEKSPLYLRVTLLFPYWEGGRFQQAVVDRMGKDGFAEVFRRPPSTTRQILHPEAYFANEQADTPDPRAPKVKGWKTLTKGTLGELDHRVIFQLAEVPDGAALASQWRGASYEIRESKKDCCLVVYASRWADEVSAERAVEAWTSHAARKALRRPLQIRRTGREVIALEGFPEN